MATDTRGPTKVALVGTLPYIGGQPVYSILEGAGYEIALTVDADLVLMYNLQALLGGVSSVSVPPKVLEKLWRRTVVITSAQPSKTSRFMRGALAQLSRAQLLHGTFDLPSTADEFLMGIEWLVGKLSP